MSSERNSPAGLARPAAGDDRQALEAVIRVSQLSKRFRLFSEPAHRLLEWLPGAAQRHSGETWALQDLSFSVLKGQCVGVIGANGSGKSTLLKLLCGVLQPTGGWVEVRGRVLALLELGGGFNPNLTGRENVIASARLLGFPDGYAVTRMREIETFADIGEFFDDPVRTYSSGMFVRLAFSAFIHLEPDIFIVDEALSVGDGPFQQKCIAVMRRMRAQGVTMIMVSHDLSLMQELCDWGMFLQNGRVAAQGSMHQVVAHYMNKGAAFFPPANDDVGALRDVASSASALTERPPEAGPIIAAARLVDSVGRPRCDCRIGERLNLQAAIHTGGRPVTLRIALLDRFARVITATHTPLSSDVRLVSARISFRVAAGEYLAQLSLRDHDRELAALDLGPVVVHWDQLWLPFHSMVGLDTRFEIAEAEAHIGDNDAK